MESKDRRFLKEAILASSKDVSVKYTGEQLNQEDLSVWEGLGPTPVAQSTGALHTTITRMIACAVDQA